MPLKTRSPIPALDVWEEGDLQGRRSSCAQQRLVPHSCGHRSCPHCQHFESQRWIERLTQALLPGNYFLITFTLPLSTSEPPST